MEATKPTNIIALTPAQMTSLLKEKPMSVFKQEIAKLPDA
jgi:hypothetical protein